MKTLIISFLLLPLFCKAQRDTIKCIMQVSNTSISGHSPIYVIHGYKVQERIDIFSLVERIGEIPVIYLDKEKNPLPKNIIVWQVKEEKD